LKMQFLSMIGLAVSGVLATPATPVCEMVPAYPPPANASFPEYVVNLDLDPAARWGDIVKPASQDIQALLDTVLKYIPASFLEQLLAKCDATAPDEFLKRFPSGYGDEIQGIADATGIDVCELIVYNIAYEVLGGCTSIITEDSNGNILHGRNLDFGLGPYNGTEGQWVMTDALRPLLSTIHFQRAGQTIYTSVHYLGYVGFLTAVKPGAFSITVDTRFDSNYDKYLIDWLNDRSDTAQFLSFLTRDTMDQEADFAAASQRLANTVMVGPSYTILAGVKAGEGAVITNSPNTTTALDYWPMSSGYPKGSASPWYLLQTNYDHWTQPPFFDNRRDPALDCMTNYVGQSAIDMEQLYNVLNAHPSRNRLTTYTTLMSAATGHIESSKQYCEEKGCVPW
jgi:acid ceramidase